MQTFRRLKGVYRIQIDPLHRQGFCLFWVWALQRLLHSQKSIRQGFFADKRISHQNKLRQSARRCELAEHEGQWRGQKEKYAVLFGCPYHVADLCLCRIFCTWSLAEQPEQQQYSAVSCDRPSNIWLCHSRSSGFDQRGHQHATRGSHECPLCLLEAQDQIWQAEISQCQDRHSSGDQYLFYLWHLLPYLSCQPSQQFRNCQQIAQFDFLELFSHFSAFTCPNSCHLKLVHNSQVCQEGSEWANRHVSNWTQ